VLRKVGGESRNYVHALIEGTSVVMHVLTLCHVQKSHTSYEGDRHRRLQPRRPAIDAQRWTYPPMSRKNSLELHNQN